MAREFRVRHEQQLPAAPEHVWNAVATGAGNLCWLYPMEVEPRVGGAVSRGAGKVVAWEPPHRLVCRATKDDGFSSTLGYHIEERADGAAALRMDIHWVHEGTVDDGWDTRADAAEKHVAFYQHSLAQYLTHFAGRPAGYIKAERAAPAADAKTFTALRTRLGLAGDASAGDTVTLPLPGKNGEPGGAEDAVVDYLSRDFVGLRTADGLYRFFDGSAWNWPVWLGHHLFADDAATKAGRERAARAWSRWLDALPS
jgi:uncharacterized protein YndB with AHSA1/START domain